MITGDPLATIYDCIQTLFKLIPELKEHLVIQEIGKLNGNVRYFMEDYGFCTPAKTVPPPKEIPKQHSEPPPTTTFNRFEPFTDTSINDEPNIQDAREDPNNIIPPFKVETPMRYFTQHPSEWSESTWDSWTSADFPNGENKPSRRETLYEKACYHYNEFTSTLNAVSMSIDENEQQQQIQNSNSEPTNTSSNNIPPATEYKITDTSTNNSISTSINNENTIPTTETKNTTSTTENIVPTTETTNVNSTTEKKTVNAALRGENSALRGELRGENSAIQGENSALRGELQKKNSASRGENSPSTLMENVATTTTENKNTSTENKTIENMNSNSDLDVINATEINENNFSVQNKLTYPTTAIEIQRCRVHELESRLFANHPDAWTNATWEEWKVSEFLNHENIPSNKESYYSKACDHYNSYHSITPLKNVQQPARTTIPTTTNPSTPFWKWKKVQYWDEVEWNKWHNNPEYEIAYKEQFGCTVYETLRNEDSGNIDDVKYPALTALPQTF